MGKRIAGAVLSANPTGLYTKELANDRRRTVALGIAKQLLGRVLMRNSHLRLSRVPLIASPGNDWEPAGPATSKD
jgi:hypothetical protein